MVKKKGAKKKTASIKGDLIVFLCLIFILTGMTIGFAHYSVLLQTQGVTTAKTQGTVHFTELTLLSYSNVDATYQPSFTDTTLDFNLHFAEVDTTQPYSATYQITVQNDTFYNQVFDGVNYTPAITDSNGTPVDPSRFSYTIGGLTVGDTIAAGSSVTFTVTMTLNASSGNYEVDGEATVETETDTETGSLMATLTGTTTGDLTGNNVRAPFTLSVMNTHNTAQTFSLLIANTSHYKLVDSAGNNLSSFTIAANATNTYTFYVERLNGAIFTTTSESTLISLLSTSNERANVGVVTLLVDETQYQDTTAPTISNVTITMTRSVEGQAVVTWSGTDDVAPTGYTVELFNSSTGARIGNPRNTVGDETSMTITGLGTGTYYAKVYGVDAEENTATSDEITNQCTTAAGHCSRSSDVPMQWRFNVTNNLTNLSSNGATTALIDSTYTATLSVTGINLNRRLPSSITVIMGGTTLAQGSGYTYNSSSGAINIPNVSGDITIRAEADGGCLVEGTMVKMADGTEKPIEQVTYHDYVLVWSYAEGKAVARQPIWIEKEATATVYRVAEFDDGTSLKTVMGHGVFNVDFNRFVDVANEKEFHVGTHIYKLGEDQTLKSVEVTNISRVEKTVKYYHVVSTEFYNIFADGVLTTDDEVLLSNLYGFDDQVRWPASRNEIVKDKNNLYDYADFDFMPRWMFDGLRVEEGGYLNNIGILPKDIFIDYLKNNQLNPDLYLPRE